MLTYDALIELSKTEREAIQAIQAEKASQQAGADFENLFLDRWDDVRVADLCGSHNKSIARYLSR